MPAPRLTLTLDRHRLWAEVRHTRPPVGPAAQLGLLQLAAWGLQADTARFIRRADRATLATFIALLAAIGEDAAQGDLPALLAGLRTHQAAGVLGTLRPAA